MSFPSSSDTGYAMTLVADFTLPATGGKAFSLSNVIKPEKLYGKEVRSIARSTASGVPRREWRGVKVSGPAGEVLNFIQPL